MKKWKELSCSNFKSTKYIFSIVENHSLIHQLNDILICFSSSISLVWHFSLHSFHIKENIFPKTIMLKTILWRHQYIPCTRQFSNKATPSGKCIQTKRIKKKNNNCICNCQLRCFVKWNTTTMKQKKKQNWKLNKQTNKLNTSETKRSILNLFQNTSFPDCIVFYYFYSFVYYSKMAEVI